MPNTPSLPLFDNEELIALASDFDPNAPPSFHSPPPSDMHTLAWVSGLASPADAVETDDSDEPTDFDDSWDGSDDGGDSPATSVALLMEEDEDEDEDEHLEGQFFPAFGHMHGGAGVPNYTGVQLPPLLGLADREPDTRNLPGLRELASLPSSSHHQHRGPYTLILLSPSLRLLHPGLVSFSFLSTIYGSISDPQFVIITRIYITSYDYLVPPTRGWKVEARGDSAGGDDIGDESENLAIITSPLQAGSWSAVPCFRKWKVNIGPDTPRMSSAMAGPCCIFLEYGLGDEHKQRRDTWKSVTVEDDDGVSEVLGRPL
ncbi:hypothetical protein EVG20_g8570 [Dentipellis fragilis]|uniref:Uncharacterized protein n=1 Tax=Dentipellis fragilis TaxID=205917 RepID=A0A4Y9Y977_9AGAM|nr:hypothetical protein EVG20_g8570 [Dentipellis fragilis]